MLILSDGKSEDFRGDGAGHEPRDAPTANLSQRRRLSSLRFQNSSGPCVRSGPLFGNRLCEGPMFERFEITLATEIRVKRGLCRVKPKGRTDTFTERTYGSSTLIQIFK